MRYERPREPILEIIRYPDDQVDALHFRKMNCRYCVGTSEIKAVVV